jgi:3-deoxy-manno-octulosonate cytidylyltransferase (CMP-KDO synthetase)
LCAELDKEDEDNENVVKVYIDSCGKYAVTFSRHILKEGVSDLFLERHVGVYGYTKDGLLTFASMPQSEREKSQRLEQLRWLDDGLDIAVISSVGRSLGIDTREDYDNFLAQLEKGQQ